MRLAHAISKVTTPIVMGVMYLLVLTPFGVAAACSSAEIRSCIARATPASGSRAPAGRSRGNLTRQF